MKKFSLLFLALTACGDSYDASSSQTDATVPDTGMADTGPRDTGTPDTGVMDAGPKDTGLVDAGPLDTGVVDAGPADTGPADAGTGDPTLNRAPLAGCATPSTTIGNGYTFELYPGGPAPASPTPTGNAYWCPNTGVLNLSLGYPGPTVATAPSYTAPKSLEGVPIVIDYILEAGSNPNDTANATNGGLVVGGMGTANYRAVGFSRNAAGQCFVDVGQVGNIISTPFDPVVLPARFHLEVTTAPFNGSFSMNWKATIRDRNQLQSKAASETISNQSMRVIFGINRTAAGASNTATFSSVVLP